MATDFLSKDEQIIRYTQGATASALSVYEPITAKINGKDELVGDGMYKNVKVIDYNTILNTPAFAEQVSASQTEFAHFTSTAEEFKFTAPVFAVRHETSFLDSALENRAELDAEVLKRLWIQWDILGYRTLREKNASKIETITASTGGVTFEKILDSLYNLKQALRTNLSITNLSGLTLIYNDKVDAVLSRYEVGQLTSNRSRFNEELGDIQANLIPQEVMQDIIIKSQGAITGDDGFMQLVFKADVTMYAGIIPQLHREWANEEREVMMQRYVFHAPTLRVLKKSVADRVIKV